MDRQRNLHELKEKVRAFCEERDWDQFHSPKDLAIGLVTESAELLDIFRFKSAEQIDAQFKDPLKNEQIMDEVADIFYFVLRFSQLYGVDLATELDRKLKKNAEKYPIDKARGNNKKYNEL